MADIIFIPRREALGEYRIDPCPSVRTYVRPSVRPYDFQMLLLHHQSMDSFEFWYSDTYDGPSSFNEPKFANFQFLNFLEFF